ncbi:MAG: DUF86 domain-containing protein [Halobacteriales archaeon]|nr:DUF86 domain-containing protein [Halobacteriales archaeon]
MRLRHAFDAANEAIGFLRGAAAEDLPRNREKAYATVFALATVGEALNAVSKEFQHAHPEIPWRKAIGLRHRLIHGYHDIQWDRLWMTVQDDLPALVLLLETLLRDAGQPSA